MPLTLFRVLLLSFILLFLAGDLFATQNQHETTNPASEKVTLQLRWFHQFQFAGYYAAIEKGFYADEGLDVTLKEIDRQKGRIKPVLEGEAEYGISDAYLLKIRADGAPVVILAQIFQHSPLVFLTTKQSGILSPLELAGKKVMLNPQEDIPLVAMLEESLGGLKNVEIVPESFRTDALLTGKLDALAAYITNQPYQLKKQGVEVNIIDPRSYGFDFYGDNLFTTEEEVRQHPERVAKMLRATLKGWDYALNHPDEIIDLILAQYNPQLSREKLAFEAQMIKSMILPDLIPLGEINLKRYQWAAETYRRLGMISEAPQLEDFIYSPLRSTTLNLSREEQAWLAAHPRLEIGVMDSWPPFGFIDHKQQLQGIGNDFIAAMNKRLGGVLVTKPGAWEDIYAAVKEKRLPALLDITPKKSREPYFNFTRPYARVPHVIIARKGIPDLNSEEELIGKTVALEEGFGNVRYLSEKYPGIKILEYQDTAAALDAVVRGEADAYAGNRAVATYIMQKELMHNLKVHSKLDRGGSVLAVGTRKDWPLLRDILQKALDDMSAKERHAIFKRWMDYEEPAIELTVKERAWLEAHPVIQVAADRQWAPIESIDQHNNFHGISVDYVKKLSELLGVEFRFATDLSWQEAIDKVQKRELDMFSAVAPSSEREKYLSYTDPYLTLPLAVFAREDAAYLGNMQELAGQRVAVVGSYPAAEYLRRDYPEIELVEARDVKEALAMLQGKEVFAYIGSILNTGFYLRELGYGSSLKITGEAPYDYHISMAVRSDWPVFAGILQKALTTIDQEERNAIYGKWVAVKFEHSFNYNLLWQVSAAALLIIFAILFWNRKLKSEVAKQTTVIKLNEERFQAIFRQAPLGIALVESNSGKIIEANPRFAEILGRSPEQMNDLDWMSITHPDDLPEDLQMMEKFSQGDINGYQMEKRYLKPNQESVWINMTIARFNLQDRIDMHHLCMIEDISTRLQLEGQLRQSQKMEAIGTLAGGIAHDFNNLLAMIIGYAELVKKTLPQESSGQRMQERLLTAATRAKELVSQILLFSRQSEKQIAPIASHQIIKEALKLLRSTIPSTIELRKEIAENCGLIKADPTQLHQIVLNLCTNAYQSMDADGGVISVKLSKATLCAEEISHANLNLEPGNYVKLEIADTGKGIDPALKERIFDPYFTTKPTGKGTGLGLSVVLGIVKSCGGDIECNSSPGRGTEMKIYFPSVEGDETSFAANVESTLVGGTEKILVVDDEELLLDMLRLSLENLGYQVVIEASGRKALERIEKDPEQFDLVISDMTMPQMNGLEFAQKLLQLRPELPIIISTGYSEHVTREKAQELGIKGFLAKPAQQADLAKIVREVLDNS